MYAVISNLDKETEDKIYGWREGLKNASISDYDIQPHVTIATHEELNTELFIKQLKDYFQDEAYVPLFFPSLGMFLNSGTLFLAPTKDPALTNFHNRYHAHFKEWVNRETLYGPDQWVPHCTLASHLTHENLVKAFDKCAEWIQPFQANLVSISLLETHFENEICVDEKLLYTVNLKKADR